MEHENQEPTEVRRPRQFVIESESVDIITRSKPRIEQLTGALLIIQSFNAYTSDTRRVVLITGSLSAMNSATRMINYIVEENNNSPESLVVMVPEREIGHIIGRSGEIIDHLWAMTGCRIEIRENFAGSNGFCAVDLNGKPAAVHRAHQLMKELIDSNTKTKNDTDDEKRESINESAQLKTVQSKSQETIIQDGNDDQSRLHICSTVAVKRERMIVKYTISTDATLEDTISQKARYLALAPRQNPSSQSKVSHPGQSLRITPSLFGKTGVILGRITKPG